MTKLDKETRTFMGITVQGDVGWFSDYTCEQKPIEDLYPELKAAFDSGIKAIKWNQYTPSWNDGEPCTFTVNEYLYTSNDVVAAAWLDQDTPDMEEAYPDSDQYYDSEDFMGYGTHPDGIDDPNLTLDSGHYNVALHTIFGDNTEVVVTPDKVVQFDYDCGY